MRRLVLYTAEFPFGKGETYLENEVPVLAAHFDEIILVPFSVSKFSRPVPSNCRVVPFDRKFSVPISVTRAMYLFRTYWLGEWWRCGRPFYYIRHGRRWWALLKQAYRIAEWMKAHIALDGSMHYSFWVNDWALALSYLKDRGAVEDFICRSGGFDIWNERHEGNYMPFRYTIYKRARGIFPNSVRAEKYLRALNVFPHKIHVAYWGTPDGGMSPVPVSTDEFLVVSCSALIPLKRVNLIPELLVATGLKIKWVHFGDGPLMQELRFYAEKPRPGITISLRGNTSNHEIHDFYAGNPVAAFVTTSSTEGLPVSVQEAISYGIPVLATDVGGMGEVVNDFTGLLMQKDFDVAHEGARLATMLSTRSCDKKFRTGVRDFWKNKFAASRVYSEFAAIIQASDNPRS